MGKYCAANDVVRCDQCDYIAVSTEVAKQHKLIVHTKKVECGKDFSCDKCNYTSARKADFKRHVRKVHNQNKTVSQHTSRTPMNFQHKFSAQIFSQIFSAALLNVPISTVTI